MVGISSYGAYIPLHRLGREEIARAWGTASLGGERSVANYDEDTITMAVAAAMNCLRGVDHKQIDGLFLATTSSPYCEKQAASIVATAIGLRQDVRTADFTNSLRGGTIALDLALDVVRSGSANNILVIASDCRIGAAGSRFEQLCGDGAAAILISNSDVIASVEGSYSVTSGILDVWRSEKDAFIHSWEERFGIVEGYNAVVREAASGFMAKYGLTSKDFTKAIIYGPDPRNQAALAKSFGFDPKTQLQDSLFASVGNTGTAYVIMLLVAALEQAKAGDSLFLASYGDGSDCFRLVVTEDIAKLQDRRGVKWHLSFKKMLPSYERLLKWRELVVMEPFQPPFHDIMVSAVWRERKRMLQLCGQKCLACGTVQFPRQRICVGCQEKDNFTDWQFSDKTGTVFTFTRDYLTTTIEAPKTMAVVDFDGGGRIILEMTDRDPEEVVVGLSVEPTFRKLYTKDSIHHYYWKVQPLKTVAKA